MKKLFIFLLLFLCSNSISAWSEVVIIDDSTEVAQIIKDAEVEMAITDKTLSDDDSISVQAEILHKKINAMQARNILRWCGAVLLTPVSLFLSGVTILAAAFSSARALAFVALAGGLSGIAGSVLLLVSAIKHQKQIKRMKQLA